MNLSAPGAVGNHPPQAQRLDFAAGQGGEPSGVTPTGANAPLHPDDLLLASGMGGPQPMDHDLPIRRDSGFDLPRTPCCARALSHKGDGGGWGDPSTEPFCAASSGVSYMQGYSGFPTPLEGGSCRGSFLISRSSQKGRGHQK